jgi:hypothetical protein
MAWEILWKTFGKGQGPTSQSHTCSWPHALTGHGRDDVEDWVGYTAVLADSISVAVMRLER